MMQGESRRHLSATSLVAIAVAAALLISIPPFAWAMESGNAASPSLSTGSVETGTASSSQAHLSAATKKPSISYRVRPANGSWQKWKANGSTAGSTSGTKPLNALAMKTSGIPEGAIQYQVYVKNHGWTAVKADGDTTVVTSGKSSVDAIRVKLTGKLSKTYAVSYRVNTQKAGWQDWKQNGAVAGSTSKGTVVRAVQVKLVKKNAASKAEGTGIVGVRYRVNSQTVGWGTWASGNAVAGTTGKALRARGFRIALDPGTYQGAVKYRGRLENGSWTGWKSNGALLSNSKIKAIQIKLTGAIAQKYDVVYRAHVSNIGWQRRMRNGEVAGTKGLKLQLEALRVNLVPKSKVSGWVKNNGSWAYYRSGKPLVNSWLVTDEHPIEATMAGLQRYWLDAKGALAVNRYVNPATSLDKKAGWTAYATPSGYVARGKCRNGDGLLLADNDGKLYTKTRWLTTSAFDGTQQKYRLVKKGPVAVVKTGLFKAGGKMYYGWEDNRGYLARSTIHWFTDRWYKADSAGVLSPYSGATTKLIEQYVKWAVKIANDNSHGYSQVNRWGPDYDCSSLVCSSLLASGFPNSGASWTGNMRACLTKIGFKWHAGTSGLRRGDIMLVHSSTRQHTEIYIGNNKLVGAHIAENGTTHGVPGDQTGNEISVGNYYNAPWQGYLRYKAKV